MNKWYMKKILKIKKTETNVRVTVIRIVVGVFRIIPQRCGKKTRGTGDSRSNGDYQDHSRVKVS